MLDTIQAIADEIGGEVYRGYSGRAMYGARCFGIVCPYHSECTEAAERHGLTGARVDNMGRDYIVYWPSLADKDAPA